MYKFSLFRNYLPFEKRVVLHVNKLDFPPLKDALCQVRLKLAQWFWKRFLNLVSVFSLFRIKLSPIGKGHDPSFEQTWIPYTLGCFVQSLVEIGPVILENKMEMWKVYNDVDDYDRQRSKADLKTESELL